MRTLWHFSQTIALCRIIIEAIFKQLGYKDHGSYQWGTIQNTGLSEHMVGLFRAANRVLNVEHHATRTPWQWTLAEARFLLSLAASLAEYAGNMTHGPPNLDDAPAALAGRKRAAMRPVLGSKSYVVAVSPFSMWLGSPRM